MDNKVLKLTDSNDERLDYIDPDTASIIIDQIAALKERIARAEEQLKLLLLEKAD